MHMWNDWLTIGPFTVHGYGVMIAVGILFAFWLAEKQADRYGLEKDRIDNFILFVIAFGYACSKLTYCLVNFKQFMTDPLSVLGSGGWVVYGGVLGGILGAYLWCKKNKWDFMEYFNVLIPCVPLAQAFGRIGCFFAGCCYGIETNAWYGVTFPEGSLGPGPHVHVVPTQLISSFGDAMIFVILFFVILKKHKNDTAAWYLILYSAGRFMIEFLRGDLERGSVWLFSTSQWISIFAFLLGAGLIYYRQKKTEVL